MEILKVGQTITVNGKKAKILGIVEYSSPPEYAIEMDDKKCWLEPFEEMWRLWQNVSGERNPVVKAIVNSDMANAIGAKHGNFHISSHGVATATASIGNTWRVEVGDSVKLWRGENLADEEWPLFIAECNKDGIMFWAGRYVSVET